MLYSLLLSFCYEITSVACKICVHCKRADLIDFEVERKGSNTFNKDIKDWKVQRKETLKRVIISAVF